MKRLLILLALVAGVFLTVVSHADGFKTKPFLWRTSLASEFNGYADSIYASGKTAAGFLADTSVAIPMKNAMLGGSDFGGAADSVFFFQLWITNEDADFASGDTVYTQVDVSPDGKSWMQTADVYPLVRAGTGTFRSLFRRYNSNLTTGTAAVNIVPGAAFLRVRIQHDNSNTTPVRLRGYIVTYTKDNDEAF